MNCLYILESKLLLVMLFTNIFSQSMGCLFFFFPCVCFPLLCKKVLNLIRSHLFDFAFITMTLRSKKILLTFMSVFCICFPL